MPKRPQTIQNIISIRFSDMYYDLIEACNQMEEPHRIHKGDLLDFCADDLREGMGWNWDEFDTHRKEIEAVIKEDYKPNRKGWIAL